MLCLTKEPRFYGDVAATRKVKIRIAYAEWLRGRVGIPERASALRWQWQALFSTAPRFSGSPVQIHFLRLDNARTIETPYYGIPTVETRAVENEDEAVKGTSQIGDSIVLKVFAETITQEWD